MLISYSHCFIFFHVPKSAGLSIKEALKPYSNEPQRFKIDRPPQTKGNKPNPMYDIWKASLLHVKATDVREELSINEFNNFYKFAFVRNPWDWQVSMYHFLKQMQYKPLDGIDSFEHYLNWVAQTKHPFPKGATKLQKDILTDENGKLLVDFVGRYETLEKDFTHVCHFLNINAMLPNLNATVHQDYRSYYNNYTRSLVESFCKLDIELFGYSFDGAIS
ncbi:MAG: sulfotransferase family 2 domain-containing protein [Desulfobacterales bacterium]|nr:sulfotransferase family 2 domain-containing protein [Desulfobacterales bacterium]